MKILITGGNGYIAKSLYGALKDKYQITTISRNNFDLTDYNATCEWFHEREYDVVIHTAISGGSRLEKDQNEVYDKNIKMFTNLVANKQYFNKLITLGSGAEIFLRDSHYGRSKIKIAESIRNIENFYNLRIFGVFDEHELTTRFIKSNIIRYINKEPIIIHSNKIMDFFYMDDLISLVDYYINHKNPQKEINCCYENKYTLINIANMINALDSYEVPIIIQDKEKLDFYCGNSDLPPIPLIGLEKGIQNTFNVLSSHHINTT